jgi:hypothetical protein
MKSLLNQFGINTILEITTIPTSMIQFFVVTDEHNFIEFKKNFIGNEEVEFKEEELFAT